MRILLIQPIRPRLVYAGPFVLCSPLEHPCACRNVLLGYVWQLSEQQRVTQILITRFSNTLKKCFGRSDSPGLENTVAPLNAPSKIRMGVRTKRGPISTKVVCGGPLGCSGSFSIIYIYNGVSWYHDGIIWEAR